MSEQLLIAIISGTSLILSVVVGTLLAFVLNRLGKIRKDTKATTEQIVNDHGDRNFRDENDGRHAETLNMFTKVFKKLGEQDDMLVMLVNGWVSNRNDIDKLNNTHNPFKERK